MKILKGTVFATDV